MFKTFTKNKGDDQIFINLYVTRKLSNNPFYIEDYLKTIDADNVYLKAFAPPLNSNYGVDHWTWMQERFNQYREARLNEYPDKNVQNMSGRAAILRTNWDKKDFWKEENRLIASERNNIALSDTEVIAIINEHIRQGIATASEMEMLSEISKRLEKPQESTDTKAPLIELADGLENGSDDDFLNSLENVHTKKNRNGGSKLGRDEVSVNYNGKHGYITFCKLIADDIKPFKYMALKKNTNTGEVFLFFNNERSDGNANVTGMTEKNGNPNVTCKDMVGKLFALLNIPEGSAKCKIKVAARKPNYLAYLITKA